MGERSGMQRFASFARIASLVVAIMSLGMLPGSAASSDREKGAAVVEHSAQARDDRVRKRPRTQLRVYPRYLYPRPCRNYHALYPLPYDVECPGPYAVRHCTFKLVQEYRPSGTVIVPRQRCWWARG
jgi:hypothetical protein